MNGPDGTESPIDGGEPSSDNRPGALPHTVGWRWDLAGAAKWLPEDYKAAGTLDFTRSPVRLLALNAAGLALLILVVSLLLAFVAATRPNASGGFVLQGSVSLAALAAVAALVVLTVVVHELIHGAGFWLVTRTRPEFGFRGYYAYAGAPEWYIPVGRYLPIGLAPLVVVTVVGLGLLQVVPTDAIPAVFVVVAFNAAGAVGDIAAVAWLCVQPRDAVVRDKGDAISLYRRTSTETH
jgi:hypothetical protein